MGALRYASDALKDDREVVRIACKQDGEALEFASPALQDDLEVVKCALFSSHAGDPLKYASAALRANRELLLELCQMNGNVLQYASDALRGDREVVEWAVKTSKKAHALQYASSKLQADKHIQYLALCNNHVQLCREEKMRHETRMRDQIKKLFDLEKQYLDLCSGKLRLSGNEEKRI